MDIDKRFERILAIYIQLQSKPVITAQDLANRFQVSIRTIYRDIKSLEKAGVPIFSEAGYGYSLVEGYKLPPALFTKEEALSFAVAEKLVQQYLDKVLSAHFSNALAKMKAVLRATDKENVQAVEEQVHLKSKKDLFNAEVPSALAILFESVASKKQVQIDYQKPSTSDIESRRIEPIGIFQDNAFWYFMAYCYLRKEVRQFRLDRIKKIELLKIDFEQSLKPLSYYLSEKDNSNSKMQQMKVWVNKDMHRFMHWERQTYGFISEKAVKDGFEMTFGYNPKYNTLSRWLMMYADAIKILEPQSFKTEMLELLASYQKQLKD